MKFSISLGKLAALSLVIPSLQTGAVELNPLQRYGSALDSGSGFVFSNAEAGQRDLGFNWRVQLVAEASRGSDERTYLGQHPLARNGLDRFDREEVRPRGKRYVTIVFANPELPRAKWGYSTDIRAGSIKPRGEWRFTVKASTGQKFITLSWKGHRRQLDVGWLIDLETGAFVETTPGGSYTYPVGEEPREFIFAIYQR